MKIARDKGFERICKLEKGKITGLLSIIRKRHVESTKMQTEIVTQHSATEWGVESSDKTQVYTVCLEVMTCPFKCELKCNQCNICVHTYTCSCNDSLHNHTICKHIHLVAFNMDREKNEQGSVPCDTRDLFLAQATRTHVLNCENEHIHDIHDSATVHQNNYIETIKTRINDKLTVLMAKLEDSKNVQALLSAESNIDTALSVLHVLSRSPCNSTMTSIEQTPPNKHIQQQRHFFSTKRKRKTKIRIAKPQGTQRYSKVSSK